MKRGAPLTRRGPLKRGKGLARTSAPKRGAQLPRVSQKRAGMLTAERVELKELHRRVVMIRWSKFEMEKAKGGLGWYGTCEKCTKDAWLQCAHIVPVGRVGSMEFDADNALPLCVGCHIYWWHKYPTQANAWIREKIGNAMVDELEDRAKPKENELGVPIKQAPNYGAIRLALSNELRQLTNGREPVEA